MFAISQFAGLLRAATLGPQRWLLICLGFLAFLVGPADAWAGLIADLTRPEIEFVPIEPSGSGGGSTEVAEVAVEVQAGGGAVPLGSTGASTSHAGLFGSGAPACGRDASPPTVQLTYRIEQNKVVLATLYRPTSVFRPPRVAG